MLPIVELTENDLKNYLCYMELHDVDDDEMANPLALTFLTKRGAIDIVDNDSGEISRITPKESKSLFGVTGMEAKKELLINKVSKNELSEINVKLFGIKDDGRK